jgi:hypothetical protein
MPLPRNSPPAFPDVEILLLHWLEAQQVPEANAVLTQTRFCTDLPYIAPGATGSWARISRVSGATVSYFTDRPIVDLDVYSFDRDASVAVATAIQSLLLWQLRGSQTPDGIVQTVAVMIAPRWLPDDNPDMSRYGATYELHTKP